MKIFIPSKGRPHSIKTHLWLGEADYKIVLHDEEERKQYLKNPTIDPYKIIISDTPHGVVNQRQRIWESQPENEWFCMMDDNIEFDERGYAKGKCPAMESTNWKMDSKCIITLKNPMR